MFILGIFYCAILQLSKFRKLPENINFILALSLLIFMCFILHYVVEKKLKRIFKEK